MSTQPKLGISTGKLSHLETGERRQQAADVARALAAYGAPQDDINRLTSLAEVPDDSTWWGAWSDVVPDWFGTFVGLVVVFASTTASDWSNCGWNGLRD
jgi:Helix-turn-helix domain